MGNELSGNNGKLRQHVAVAEHRQTMLSEQSSSSNPYTQGSVDAVDGMASINDFCEILTEIATEIDTQYTDDRTFDDTTSSIEESVGPELDDKSPAFCDSLSFVPNGHFVDSISTVFSFRYDVHGMIQSVNSLALSLTL